jgi:hypothetical protein
LSVVLADGAARARSLLRALADLAPSGQRRGGSVIPLDWFRWVPEAVPAFFDLALSQERRKGQRPVRIDRDFGERLAAVAQVRSLPHSLRVG